MAIDTAAKRFSMLGIVSTTIKHVITDTISGVNASERSTFIDLYSGIALDNPSSTVIPIFAYHRRQFNRS